MTRNLNIPRKLTFLLEPHRYKVAHGGRGSAKSWTFARTLLFRGVLSPIRVLCAREFQNSIQDSVHRLLADQIKELGISEHYEVQRKAIYGSNGTEFGFEGIRQNVTRIKSYEGVDIVWVEEAEKVSANSWNILIPTIRREGSEIWVTFNPEFEDDETYDRFVLNPPDDGKVVEVNFRDNPWFPDVLEKERLALRARDPVAYDHVWEGKCRKWLEGAIYANELRAAYDGGRVCDVPHDDAVPVFTAWDIGYTDDTSIWWFQVVSGELHIIDCYSISGGSPSELATQVLGRQTTIDIVKGKVVVTAGEDVPELAHRRAYRYERHWLPHDAKAKVLAAAGKSIQQQLGAAFGVGKVRIATNLSKEDGIQAARTTFPRCWFDADRTREGMKALRRYRRDLQADDVSLQRAPKHDWSSHYADAFRYLAVAWNSKPAPQPADDRELDAWGRPRHESNWKTG